MTSGISAAGGAREAMRGAARDLSKLWWGFLVLGIVWTLFGTFVLTFRPGSVSAVAALVGVAFLFGGIASLAVAPRVPGWHWLFVVAGVLSVVAGIVAFLWPDITVYVISVFLAWYLIIFGIIHVVGSLAGPKLPWWWTSLLLGIAEFILGVWAIRSWDRSVITLLTIVGIWAIAHGVREIFAAFALKEAGRWAQQA